jgi:hypothetical protein
MRQPLLGIISLATVDCHDGSFCMSILKTQKLAPWAREGQYTQFLLREISQETEPWNRMIGVLIPGDKTTQNNSQAGTVFEGWWS